MAATTYFNKFPSYCRMVAHAKSLAKRSVLVDHCGLEHIDISSELSNVEQVYSIEKETRRGFSKLSLIEFKTGQDAERLVKRASHNEGLLPIPLNFLRYNGRMASANKIVNQVDLPYKVEHVRISSEKELSTSFSSYAELVSNNMMSQVALKLRFITLVNFERILCSGVFEEYELMPFGSSMIDVASESGDLDLIITRKSDHHQAVKNAMHQAQKQYLKPNHTFIESHSAAAVATSPSSKLVHLDKSLYSETKDTTRVRGLMRWFDHILREYMPLTDGLGVLTLHRAKVPIIKFTSRITNIDCDLSFDLGLDHREYRDGATVVNSGILMTEILYYLCRQNNLLTAFVIYMRLYAKLNSITSKVPGVGMTNFQFLSLLIFFLQQVKCDSPFTVTVQPTGQPALVPPFKDLLSGRHLENSREPICLNDDRMNHMLPLLLTKFFNFYSHFDFDLHALNLFDSTKDRKLDNSTIFVSNPIETNRNICHNVNRKAVETFVRAVRTAHTNMRTGRGSCPLAMIRNLMIKHQKLSKKNRTIGINIDELDDDSQPFNPEDIAQDVCR